MACLGEVLKAASMLGPSEEAVMGWCGVMCCGVVWSSLMWCGMVWCSVVWRGVVWCGMV